VTRDFNRLDKLTRDPNPSLSTPLVVASDEGEKVNLQDALGALVQSISWHQELSGVSSASLYMTGEFREIDNTLSADYATDFGVVNQHVYIYVDDITTGGDIVITGTKVSESTGIPVAGTETITVDDTVDQYYQTDAKWFEVTNIDISSGAITGIDYDVGIVGYLDMANRDFTVVGLRAEFEAGNALADVGIRVRKIQDDGGGKMSIVPIELCGYDSTAGNGEFDDQLRTAGDDRSFTFTVTAWASGGMAVIKQTDYNTYFTNDENVLESSSKAEGIIVDFVGIPSGNISNVEHGTVTIFYTLD
jgi:hypothetical protein